MKYKVGDKIRLKGTDSTGTVIDIIRNQLVIILSDGSKIVEWPENVVLIEGLVEEEEIEFTEEDKYWCDIMSESDPTTYVLPQGYQFKNENGDVINASKIVLEKKKPKYPKTYEECCKAMKCDAWFEMNTCYHGPELCALYKLLICRDAYWKIAGEEMGLGKSWEPDWSNPDHDSYPTITKCGGKVIRTTIYTHDCLLAFPTEEMRDAFYEHFKDLIEECKELL